MTRRSVVAAISLFLHAVVLIALATVDLWRPVSEWPTPRSALAFVGDVQPVRIDPIDPPNPMRARDLPGSPSQSQIDAAPVAPPPDIAPEMVIAPGLVSAPDESHQVGFGPASSTVREIGLPAPPPPPEPKTPIRLHSGIRAPQRIVDVRPAYPAIARSAHVEGMVIIEATIDERGTVVRTALLRSIPLLDDAAIAAVSQWKFSPTLLNGVAVPIVMTVTVNFTLN